MGAMPALKRTPLFETHTSLGATMGPFAGWEMPIQYASIRRESRSVRSSAGLFDVSHMGRIEIRGGGAAAFLTRVLSMDAHALRLGRARYNVICNEEGGIIDDCIVYRRGETRYLLVPNASNTAAVLGWLWRWAPPSGVEIDDLTAETAMIAHQGPSAVEMLKHVTPADLSAMKPFTAMQTEACGAETLLARTGYTGEDGFELILPSEAAAEVWSALMKEGAAACGLGARDILRLEAGLLLHGADIDISKNPYEAGLGRFVDLEKEDYVSGEALRRVRERGVSRRLVGFTMLERGIPRHGYPITDDARQIGVVTSGAPSPSLDRTIGLGYVPTDYSAPGTHLQVDIRGRRALAEVTALPFYTRRRNS